MESVDCYLGVRGCQHRRIRKGSRSSGVQEEEVQRGWGSGAARRPKNSKEGPKRRSTWVLTSTETKRRTRREGSRCPPLLARALAHLHPPREAGVGAWRCLDVSPGWATAAVGLGSEHGLEGESTLCLLVSGLLLRLLVGREHVGEGEAGALCLVTRLLRKRRSLGLLAGSLALWLRGRGGRR